jgi:hypothetical protein
MLPTTALGAAVGGAAAAGSGAAIGAVSAAVFRGQSGPLAIEANPAQNGLRATKSGECRINAQSLADAPA